MALSDNIKNRRQTLNFSQEYVADQIGISRQAVAKWENGKSTPNAANLASLADVLEISVAELVGAQNEETGATFTEKERLHNARMHVSRFLGYIFVLSGVQGYFRYYPNDAPLWWWLLVFAGGLLLLVISSRDMYKRSHLEKDQICIGAIFFIAVLLLPRWLPFSAGWNWFVSSLVAAGCVIYLNLKFWRHIWPQMRI